MTRYASFTGAIAVLYAALLVARLVEQDIIDRPNGFGLFWAALDLLCGFLVVRSVWRDRL